MKVAIIGAGFTGLSAAYHLARSGYDVSVFESNDYPGGLAAGFKPESLNTESWQWSLEHHYHHIFSSDKDIISWLQTLGLTSSLYFSKVKTSMRYQEKQFRLDSPLSLLACPALSVPAKVRTAATLAILKALPIWKQLEKYTTEDFLQRFMGNESWSVLWQPLMEDKFGQYSGKVNAAWFWARIQARTPQLGYFKGGFGQLAQDIVDRLQELHVRFFFSTDIRYVEQKHGQWQIERGDGSNSQFDCVLFTGSASLLTGLVPELPEYYSNQIVKLKSLGARTLILELNKPFFTDGTYWLNVNERSWPFLAVVEHTNLVDPQFYNNKTILYVGKYHDLHDSIASYTKDQLFDLYQPYLEILSPGFSREISGSWLFSAPFAQPVVEVNHSKFVPAMTTPLEGLFWSGMQHVYPWDRGTNFAVRLGKTVANVIHQTWKS